MNVLSEKKKAIVLLSGGLDSATCVALARANGYDVSAITFDYQQRHVVELEACKQLIKFFNIKNHVDVKIDLRSFGASALTDNIDVPKHESVDDIGDEIPITYVPARNTIFLSYALAFAEVQNASAIYIGVNALDYSGYPDCRPEYIHAFEKMANLATKAGVEGTAPIEIVTPLINLTKAQIIQRGIDLGVDYSLTHSCYDPAPDGSACGKCDSCLLRKKGFEEAGIQDPTRYI